MKEQKMARSDISEKKLKNLKTAHHGNYNPYIKYSFNQIEGNIPKILQRLPKIKKNRLKTKKWLVAIL
jgi:hypothetical protein